MNKNQHPNAAEALLNWTLTRADGRIVVQHSSGAFYAAAKEGDSGIAESILYMLADSLLSATLSPAHIVDEEEVEVAGYRSGTSGHVYTEGYGLERPEPLMTVAQHQRIKAALSADNQRVLPPEPILAAPHPMAALSAPPASERQQAAGCKCVYATAKNTAAVRNGSEMGGYLKAECEACQQRSKSTPSSEQQQAIFAIPDMDEHLLQILGRPNFWCSPIASVLRHGGAEIRRKAEDEQAVVIHWLLTLYLKHGAKWWEVATAEIERVRAAQSSTSSKGGDL